MRLKSETLAQGATYSHVQSSIPSQTSLNKTKPTFLTLPVPMRANASVVSSTSLTYLLGHHCKDWWYLPGLGRLSPPTSDTAPERRLCLRGRGVSTVA